MGSVTSRKKSVGALVRYTHVIEADPFAERKGFAKAKVAVARRLAELLFTLWRDEKDFEPRLVA